MGIVQLGPLMIKYEWLILLIAGFITYVVIKKILKNKPFSSEFLDTLFNIVFIWIILYKLSIILFRPSLLFTNPLGLLYFNGGTKGGFLASIVSVIYLLWKSKKLSWEKEQLVQGVTIAIVTAFLSYWLVRTLVVLLIQ